MILVEKYTINGYEIENQVYTIPMSYISDKNIHIQLRIQCLKNVVDDFVLELTLMSVQLSSHGFVYQILLLRRALIG